MLTLENLAVSIEGKKILRGLTFEFLPGKTYIIMGPNGSGKSTLASAIMGHPKWQYGRGSRILLDGKNILSQTPDKRAQAGLFLSFQTPLSLPGVTVFELLRLALEKRVDPVTLHKQVKVFADELRIKGELLRRSLNEGFSGGEKKKLEALQAALLAPRFALFDEIDTGVDVDALKGIVSFLKKHLPKEATLVFITHNTKLLRAIRAHRVIVLKDGRLVRSGGTELARQIEKKGFESVD